jgi:uncharacterized protein (DUF2147 family)
LPSYSVPFAGVAAAGLEKFRVRYGHHLPDQCRLLLNKTIQAAEGAGMRAGHLTVVALLLLIGSSTAAFAADLTAAGLWQAIDKDSGQPTGWFLIRDHEGVFDGTIVKMYLRPGESLDVICDRCTDDRRDKPWLGLDIIRGMQRDGLSYKNGTILDPRYGRIYSAMMTLSPDGQTLVVRGYLGISLLGQNQYWTRLPDTAFGEIDPRFNPDPPKTRKSKTQAKPENSAGR